VSLLFDLIATQPIGGTKYHGGGEYTKEVFKRLIEKKGGRKISCVLLKSRDIDQDILSLAKEKCDNIYYLSNIKEVQTLLEQNDFTVFFSGLPLRYNGLKFKNTFFVFTIHGLRPIELRTDAYEIKYINSWIQLVKLLVKRLGGKRYTLARIKQFGKLFAISDDFLVITDSSHSYYAILSEYRKQVEDKLLMLYCPVLDSHMEHTAENSVLQKYGLSKQEYFLLINANRWEKNCYRAVQAFSGIFRCFPGFNKKVVLVGAKDNIRFLARLKKDSRFILTDYLSSGDLDCLYKNAFCFVYPTLNEGFGYPPLKSMNYNVPVIASAVTSVPEVAGDGALYFNPYSVDEIKNRILQVYHEEKLRKKLQSQGLKRIQEVESKQKDDTESLINILLKRA